MRIGISIVPSAARHQHGLGETVLGFTRPFRQSGLVLSPFPPYFIGLNGCSIFPASSVPNLAKRSLLFVLPHHFTFLTPLNFLVQQQFVLLHFSTFNFTFLNLQHWTLSVNAPLIVKSLFLLPTHPKLHQFFKTIKKSEQRIVMLHRIKRRRLMPTVNEMMATHKNAVVIANIRQN